MESGAQSLALIGPTAEIWQEPYDQLVRFANCSSQNDSFTCLQHLPADKLLEATEKLTRVISKAYGASIFVYSELGVSLSPPV